MEKNEDSKVWNMSVTMKEIAELAKVSISTVSRILNNNDGFISEATKKRVLKIVEEQSYKPNPFARSLVTNRSKSLGIIVPDIINPFFPELVRGADDTAQKLGYSITICNSDDKVEKEEHYLDYLAQRGTDGIILASGGLAFDTTRLAKYRLPVVTVDRVIKPCKSYVGSVCTDLEMCGYLGAEYFIKKNHKRIVFLCGQKDNQSSEKRYKGYCDALKEAGIEIDEELCGFGEFSHEFGYQKTNELLEKTDFTAMCCMSDMLALGAMRALREHKVKVPRDCAVLGCDNIFLSAYLERPLSTLDRSTYELGARGVEILVDSIEGKLMEFKEEIIAPSLVLRKTT